MMANLARKLSNNNPSSQNSRDTPQNTEANNTGDKNKVKDKKSSKPKLVRRHSITICESRSRVIRKLSTSPTSSNCDQQKSGQHQSGPFSIMPLMNSGMNN